MLGRILPPLTCWTIFPTLLNRFRAAGILANARQPPAQNGAVR